MCGLDHDGNCQEHGPKEEPGPGNVLEHCSVKTEPGQAFPDRSRMCMSAVGDVDQMLQGSWVGG